MSAKRLWGVIPALITPMTREGNVDFPAMEENVRFLADAGVHGFFVNGTTAEGPILTRKERKEAVRITKDVSGGRQAICAACIAPSAAQVIEEIRDLEPLEPDYIVSVTPFYYPVSQEAILDHYAEICASTDLPVIFYDIPQHTHNPMGLETRLELVRRGIGAGFKDSTGNFVTFSRSVLEGKRDGFSWIQGDDLLDAFSVGVGASGVVTGLSNITPKPYLKLFELAEKGDHAGLVEVQKEINRLAGVISAAGGRVIPGIKSAMAALGRCEPWVRFKSLTASPSEAEAVRHVVESIGDILS